MSSNSFNLEVKRPSIDSPNIDSQIRTLKTTSSDTIKELNTAIEETVNILANINFSDPQRSIKKSSGFFAAIKNWSQKKSPQEQLVEKKLQQLKELKKKNDTLFKKLENSPLDVTKIRTLSAEVEGLVNKFNDPTDKPVALILHKKITVSATLLTDQISTLDKTNKEAIKGTAMKLNTLYNSYNKDNEDATTNSQIDREHKDFIQHKLGVEITKVSKLQAQITPLANKLQRLEVENSKALVPATSDSLSLCAKLSREIEEIEGSHQTIEDAMPQFITAKNQLATLEKTIDANNSLPPGCEKTLKSNIRALILQVINTEKELLKGGKAPTKDQAENFKAQVSDLAMLIDAQKTEYAAIITTMTKISGNQGSLVREKQKLNESLENLGNIPDNFYLSAEAKKEIQAIGLKHQTSLGKTEKEILKRFSNARTSDDLNNVFQSYNSLNRSVEQIKLQATTLRSKITEHVNLRSNLNIYPLTEVNSLNLTVIKRPKQKLETDLGTYIKVFGEKNQEIINASRTLQIKKLKAELGGKERIFNSFFKSVQHSNDKDIIQRKKVAIFKEINNIKDISPENLQNSIDAINILIKDLQELSGTNRTEVNKKYNKILTSIDQTLPTIKEIQSQKKIHDLALENTENISLSASKEYVAAIERLSIRLQNVLMYQKRLEVQQKYEVALKAIPSVVPQYLIDIMLGKTPQEPPKTNEEQALAQMPQSVKNIIVEKNQLDEAFLKSKDFSLRASEQYIAAVEALTLRLENLSFDRPE